MRSILFLILLTGMELSVWGQDGSHSRANFFMEKGPSEQLDSQFSYSDLPQLYHQEQKKEKLIEHLVRVYKLSKDQEKPMVLSQLKDQLFKVLDLKIQQSELKIKDLRRDLSLMQEDKVYKEKIEEIEQLKGAILKVEDILQFRKAHRVAIVLNRLKDLGMTPPEGEKK